MGGGGGSLWELQVGHSFLFEVWDPKIIPWGSVPSDADPKYFNSFRT